jgi:hypothetical protein
MAELKSWLSPAIATLKNDTTSGAADALSPADSAWSKRYQAAYDSWDEQIQQIQLGAAYTTMLMDNFELGTQDTVDVFNANRDNLRQIKEYWEQHPLTGADLERSLGLNELARRGSAAVDAIGNTLDEISDGFQEGMSEADLARSLALNAIGESWIFSRGALGGQSTIPGPIGGGGLNAFAQVQALQDTISRLMRQWQLQVYCNAPHIGSHLGALLGSACRQAAPMEASWRHLLRLRAHYSHLADCLVAKPLLTRSSRVQAMVQTCSCHL